MARGRQGGAEHRLFSGAAAIVHIGPARAQEIIEAESCSLQIC